MQILKKMLKTFQAQLFLNTAMLVITVLLFTIAAGNFFYSKAIHEQTIVHTTQLLNQVQTILDNYIYSLEQIITYLSENEIIISYLRLCNFYEKGRIDYETEARVQMFTYVKNNPGLIGGILIVNKNDMYISNEIYRISRNSLKEDTWYKQAVAGNGKNILQPKPIGRNIRNFRNYSTGDIVSITRAVKDPKTDEILGVICIDMSLKAVEKLINGITLGKAGYIFVVDENADIVYAPINETVYRVNTDMLKKNAGIQYINNTRYRILYTESSLTSWKVIGVFRNEELPVPLITLYKYLAIITLVSVSMALIVSFGFSYSFTNPISKLRKSMNMAEQGDLNVRFNVQEYYGEIIQLGTSFNSMMDKIRGLIDLVYIEQKQKRKAEIQSLQAQIKPHFLYNTLDTIRWMAEAHNAPDISKLVTALTKLFRISLSKGRDIITVEEELEHVRSYLYIQKERYEEKLNYTIYCNPALHTCEITKLVLQPLVENAIYHGIKQKKEGGTIDIRAEKSGQSIRISIADTGIGMTKKECDRINAALLDYEAREYTQGYGLFNVNNRIRLTYGKAYGLHYIKNKKGGITVRVHLPLKFRTEDVQSSDKEQSC